MKQFENDKICKYCYGCNKLELEDFNGVVRCNNFMQGKDMAEYYKEIRRNRQGGK